MSIDELINKLPVVKISAGQILFHQGQVCEAYFILVRGSARVFTRSSSGKEVLLYHVEPGDLCILTTTCLLGGERYPAEGVAETDMAVRLLPKTQFDELINNNAEFRAMVFASFGARIGSLIRTIEKLTLESIEQRLAKYLLIQPGNSIHITHQDIAMEIGSAREVVSRHLKRFEAKQWLELGRGQIVILDREALYQLT